MLCLINLLSHFDSHSRQTTLIYLLTPTLNRYMLNSKDDISHLFDMKLTRDRLYGIELEVKHSSPDVMLSMLDKYPSIVTKVWRHRALSLPSQLHAIS